MNVCATPAPCVRAITTPVLASESTRRGRRRLLVALLAASTLGHAAPTVDQGSDRNREAQRAERQFLHTTAAQMKFQAQASRIVLARTTNGAVREVAADVVARYERTQPELLRLLHARGMAMPMLPNDQSKLLRDLDKLKGPRLDRVYIDEVAVRALQAELALHERAGPTLDDPRLRAWTEHQRPVLRGQVDKAARALAPARAGGPAARST